MNNSEKLIKNLFELDKIDMIIISSLQDNPAITFTEIANKANKSQPTIGMRAKRLEKIGLLKKMYGINFNNTNLILAYVSIQTSNIRKLAKEIDGNIGKILIWSSSGKYNLNMLVCGEKLKDIETMVNTLFREESIKLIKFEIIDSLLSEFILPLRM